MDMNQLDFMKYSSKNFDFELYNDKIDIILENQFDFVVEPIKIVFTLNTSDYFDFVLSDTCSTEIKI